LDAQDPETEDARQLAPSMWADELQLLYSMVLHGRAELSLMSDEYGALTMVLLRFLAFPSAGPGAVPAPARGPSAVPARGPEPARTAPLRAPAPPALSLPLASTPVAAPVPPSQAPAAPASPAPVPAACAAAATPEPPSIIDRALGDRWHALVTELSQAGALAALVRELATQGGLCAVDDTQTPPRWTLRVERETLRTAPLRDKLAAALGTALGHPIELHIEPGEVTDSPARRDAAERQRRQAAAVAAIEGDPVVRELLSQFKTARIVPGSIKPV
jgi:DNA polymerase-3 subunit gamma/tau